jgi:calcyphosin
MEINISTQQISDEVHYSLRSVCSMVSHYIIVFRHQSNNILVSQEQVLKVWHSVGLAVREQMENRKGVRLEKFGSFGFDIMGEPCFNISTEFGRTYRVRQTPIPTHDNAPISKLNITQVSRISGIDRALAEKIYFKYISCFGSGVRTGQNALLSIHRVAEVFVSNDTVKCAFMAEFVDSVIEGRCAQRKQPTKRPSSAPRMGRSQPIDAATKTRPSTPGRQGGSLSSTAGEGRFRAKKKAPVRGKKLVESGQSRRNPITGDGDSRQDMVVVSCKKQVPGGATASHRNPILDGDDYEDDEMSEPVPTPLDRKHLQSGNYGPRPQSAGSSSMSRSTVRSAGTVDSRSLMYSPREREGVRERAQYRSNAAKNIERNVRGPRQSGTPRRATPREAARPPVDARALAAKALGAGDVVERLKEKIVARGGTNGIKGIGRLLRIMDNNGDKRLNREELTYGLRDYGINVTKTEIEQLFLHFDRDHNGFVDIDEFLIGIRGDLSDRRKSLIRMAFDILDTDRSGMVTVDELSAVYDVSWNPAVRAGKMTEGEAMKEFMKQWDRLDGDGMISIEEFEDYYKGVSSSIDGDDYFELMMRNAWRIPGGIGMAANTANKRVLVTNKDGSQRVVTVHNELGMKPGDRDAVRARLAQQGVNAENIELHGGLDTTEKPRKVPLSH